MSPILVRPVREQLEHDRIIRLLHGEVPPKVRSRDESRHRAEHAGRRRPDALYPDLVLLSPDRGRRLQIIVEIETGESVNHLEALAQWAHYGRVRAAFHLYVPASMVDVARRLYRGQPDPRRRNLELPRRRRRAAVYTRSPQPRSRSPLRRRRVRSSKAVATAAGGASRRGRVREPAPKPAAKPRPRRSAKAKPAKTKPKAKPKRASRSRRPEAEEGRAARKEEVGWRS